MASQFFKSLIWRKKGNDSNKKELGSMRLFALKDSRWFEKKECELFKNVVESGYILELRMGSKINDPNVNKDRTATLEYGIVLWGDRNEHTGIGNAMSSKCHSSHLALVTEKLKSFKVVVGGKEQTAIVIHLVNARDKGEKKSRGMRFSTLESFWYDGTEIRINNMGDRSGVPHDSSKIWERVNRAFKGSYKWNDSHSFVSWCRYGHPVPAEECNKKRHMQNAAIVWGSVSASAGAMLYLSKQQRRYPKNNRS